MPPSHLLTELNQSGYLIAVISQFGHIQSLRDKRLAKRHIVRDDPLDRRDTLPVNAGNHVLNGPVITVLELPRNGGVGTWRICTLDLGEFYQRGGQLALFKPSMVPIGRSYISDYADDDNKEKKN